MNQDRTKRKLTAIFSADVVGYSRLMEEDEAWTIKSLEENKRLISGLVEEYKGRVVDAPGDNILAEFNSVINAVECAIKIQQELKKKNDNLIEARRMHFRVGVNLGDIVEEDGRIYGSGVNIAARIEGLAQPSGICISGTAYDQVRTKLDLGYEYLGEHNAKNISEPVRVYRIKMEPDAATAIVKEKKARLRTWQRAALAMAIFILGAVVYIVFDKYYLDRRNFEIEVATTENEQAPIFAEVEEAPKTIAVLPFENLSSDPEQVYFVDGLTEELLNSLTKIPDLRVIARTSSFAFKGTSKTVQEIAAVLGADHILEGSVRKAGNVLRITAQLIQAVDGIHLWSETYDRELKDIFAVQEDIAMAVAEELKITLGIGTSLKQLGGTDNLEAYELYLTAMGQFNNAADQAGYKRALQSIEAAIALDPQFALAWVLKSMIHIVSATDAPADTVATAHEEALFAAQKAIELEPNLSDGYLMLGILKWEKGDFIDGESAFRKAFGLTTEPLSTSSGMTATCYNAVGYFKKAHEILAEARKNDPLNQGTRQQYMFYLAFQNDLQGAEEEYERGMALLGDKWKGGYKHLAIVRLGASNNLSSEEILYSDPIFDVAKEHLESPEQGLEALRRITINEDKLSGDDLSLISLWAAYFGDPDFAMNTMEKSVRISGVQGFFSGFQLCMKSGSYPDSKNTSRRLA